LPNKSALSFKVHSNPQKINWVVLNEKKLMKTKKITTYHSISDDEQTDRYVSAISEFDANEHEILSISYTPDGEIEHKTVYKYNDDGLKIAETNYFDEDEVSDSHVFEYNAQKLLIKEVTSFIDGSETIKTIVRDEQAKTVTVSSHDDEGELEDMEWVQLNAENRVIERKLFDEDEKIKEHFTYIHDDAGNVLNAKEYDENGNLYRETVQEFNSYNEPTKRIVKNAKGEIVDYTIYTYDDKNRVLEVKFGNRYLIKHEYNAENNSHTEMRILGSGQMDEKVTYIYNSEGKTIREERLDSTLEYDYEYADEQIQR